MIKAVLAVFSMCATLRGAHTSADSWNLFPENGFPTPPRSEGRHRGDYWPQLAPRPPPQYCDVDEVSRVGCGKARISRAACEALNCCYDTRQFIRAYDGPRCYYGNIESRFPTPPRSEGLYRGGYRLQPPSWLPAQFCDMDDARRVACGEPDVTRADCEALNCCYETRQFFRAYDGPLCFYGKTESRFLTPPRSEGLYRGGYQLQPPSRRPSQRCKVDDVSRMACGEPDITRADCEALNCCYDTRQFFRAYDGPLCFYGKTESRFPTPSRSEGLHWGGYQLQPPSWRPSRLCEVDEPRRMPCGKARISRADCEALNCCYDTRQFIRVYDGPRCYYRKTESRFPTPPRSEGLHWDSYPLQPRAQRPPQHPPQRCEGDEATRVGCGEQGITPADCEALNCCYDTRQFIRPYDGPLCYYGKTVTVQCTKDGQFVVVAAKDVTLPHISPDNLSLLEATGKSCTAVDSNADFTIYQFPVTSCGTRSKVEGEYVIYENMMTSSYEVGIGPHGSITRDSTFQLTFQCRYLATAVETLLVDVNAVPPPHSVVDQGHLRVELSIANGVCETKGCSDVDVYRSFYMEADYPVTKTLREPIYVQVHMLERTDSNIALILNRCWATSTPDPLRSPQWDLVINGCSYEDDRYQTDVLPVSPSAGLQYPTHFKRFSVKMFAFVDQVYFQPLQERVFLHCATEVCQLSATETCEPSCGRTKRAALTAQNVEKVLVSSGEVLLIADMPDFTLLV